MLTSEGAAPAVTPLEGAAPKELYLDLLKKCLTRYLFPQTLRPIKPRAGTLGHVALRPIQQVLARKNLVLARQEHFDPELRARGADFPIDAVTMIGLNRPKLSVGGYAIVDDYVLPACRAAVEDYRGKHGIDEPIRSIEWTGAYWLRSY